MRIYKRKIQNISTYKVSHENLTNEIGNFCFAQYFKLSIKYLTEVYSTNKIF